MMEIPQKSRLSEVLDILGIKKATIYPWLQSTGIKSKRDSETGMVYFDREQVETLLNFQSYLKTGGVMRNWQAEQAIPATGATIATIEAEAVAEEDEDFEELELEGIELEDVEAVEEGSTGEMVVSEGETIQLEDLPPIEINRSAEILANAQRQAAGVIIAQNLLASQYIDRPETLPPDIQKIINNSAPVPKRIDPIQYAQTLILSHNSTGQHQAA